MAEENRETRAICPVCMHHCRLTQEQYGRCRARKNSKGKIISINYGKITGLMLDPIEKKPLTLWIINGSFVSRLAFALLIV